MNVEHGHQEQENAPLASVVTFDAYLPNAPQATPAYINEEVNKEENYDFKRTKKEACISSLFFLILFLVAALPSIIIFPNADKELKLIDFTNINNTICIDFEIKEEVEQQIKIIKISVSFFSIVVLSGLLSFITSFYQTKGKVEDNRFLCLFQVIPYGLSVSLFLFVWGFSFIISIRSIVQIQKIFECFDELKVNNEFMDLESELKKLIITQIIMLITIIVSCIPFVYVIGGSKTKLRV